MPARRSISRSTRSRAPRCAPRTCRARSRPWRWPMAARCCTRPTFTCRRSPSARATRRGWSNSTPHLPIMVDASAITVLVLDRPRHADIINGVRSTGAAVRLITDGDVAGVIHCADPDNTGVDMYIGTGGAPEGVLAAVALRCIGGQMQCRLILDGEEKREGAAKMGTNDPRMIYGIEDMARGDCLFAATGVTDGSLLSGVKFRKDVIQTETVVMRSVTGTVRYIKAEHRQLEKFHLD